MLGYRDFTIDDYLAILRRRRWVIVLPVVLGIGIAYGIALKLPYRYTSQTLILIEGQKVPDSFVKPVVTGDLTSRLSSIKERILSRSQLEPIINRLRLFPDLAGQVPAEELVARLRTAVSLKPTTPGIGAKEGEVQGFYINVTLSSAQLAQQVCSEIASMLISENLRQREQNAQGTTTFLQSQLLEAKARLDTQDAKLAEFKSRYMGELPDEAQMNLNVLSNLNSQFDAVTQALDRAQAEKSYAQSMLRQQLAAWEMQRAAKNVRPETLEQQLATLENELLVLKTRYTDDHPDVVKQKVLIEALNKRIAAANTVKPLATKKPESDSALLEPPNIQQLRGEVHMYDQTIQEKIREQQKLQQQIGRYESRVQLSPNVEQQYRQITRDYQNAVDSYNELLKHKDQSVMGTELELREQGERFHVIDPASFPNEPSFPKKPQFLAGGFGAGLAIGLGLALLLEMRDKSLRTEQDIQHFLHLPTLAFVPTIARSNNRSRRWRAAANKEKNEMSVMCGAEEFRKLRSHLELLREQRRIRTVLVSSSLAQEGKTFGSANLAQVMARQQERRVLAIDADLRLPRLHLSFGSQLAPGLSDYLSGAADEFSIIQRGPVSNLSFIAGGNLAANPSELIGNGRLKLLLQALAPAFDWIIIDSPPVVPVADARLLAEFCDTVVLVIRAGETPFDIAQKACQELRGKPVLGVILNRVEPTYAYSSYYYKPRTEGETVVEKGRRS